MRFNKISKKEARYISIARKHNLERALEVSSKKYIFRNNTKGTLTLHKRSLDDRLYIEPNETWQGDESYMYMVQSTNEAKIVSVIPSTQEANIMQNKLILDQPDTVTSVGKIEHVVEQAPPVVKLNETKPAPQPSKEVLITEDPMEGIEIILND